MATTFYIKSLIRVTADGLQESLPIQQGINVIAGNPNSGKTVWLNMIDFLLGDTGAVEDAIPNETKDGEKLFDKYVAIKATLAIGEENIEVERRWHEPGQKTKIFVNEEPINASDFSSFLLNKLGIPILNFPKGNPYAERAWPSLSWKMMSRHLYRQERFWSDIADRQPEVEQHAVLCQFLGIASKLFSPKLGTIIDRRKKLLKFEAQKSQFDATLDTIARSIVSTDGPNITFYTEDSINKAIEELEARVQQLLSNRHEMVSEQIDIATAAQAKSGSDGALVRNIERRNILADQYEELLDEVKLTVERHLKFANLAANLEAEISKLERSRDASEVFADLKVTHCPCCDQPVMVRQVTVGEECYLCHQPVTDVAAGNDRLEFEISQLKSEHTELKEIAIKLDGELSDLNFRRKALEEEIRRNDQNLKPLKQLVSAAVDERLSLVDAERGRVQEQIENYRRILNSLDYKKLLTKQLDDLNREIAEAEKEIDEEDETVNFGEIAELLEDKMADYINEINKGNPSRWELGRIKFKINEKRFTFKVNEANWSSIGATLKVYFLFAYHYALLSLSDNEACNCPGFLVIDFPPELADGVEINDKENYLIEPFITLAQNAKVPIQAIFAGRVFENLQGANEISMNSIWK